MKPIHFIDFRVKKGMKSSECMMKFFRAMHSHFSANPGKTAVSFPNSSPGEMKTVGNVIRIFAEDAETIESLIDFMNGQSIMGRFTKSMIALTPKNHIGGFEEFLYTRVPAARSRLRRRKNIDDRTKEGLFSKRLSVLSEVEDLPYISMSSMSQNGVHFSLHFKRIEHTTGDSRSECSPSNYGLSLSSRRFSLPKLPLLAQMHSEDTDG